MPVSVHLVNTDQFEGTGFEEIVDEIISIANENDAGLRVSNLSRKDFGNYKVRIYYSYAKYPPKWRDFLEPILDKNSVLAKCENQSYSYACFIGYDKNVYVITGGFGSLVVGRFMVPNFGLEILVRLFERDSKVVKHIQERGFTGNVLGQTKFYRGDQRFSDENQFGKILKKVQAELNKKILKKTFGFSDGDLRREVSGCLAKESFQINKSVNFDTLLALIKRFDEILRLKPKFSLNKVIHISNRNSHYKKLREELDEWVIDNLYNECKKGIDPDVDFCHKYFEKYLSASSYLIMIEKGEPIALPKHSTFGDIVRLLKIKEEYLDEDVHHFKFSVLERRLQSLDEEGVILTSGYILDHIHGEFSYKGQTYFLMDREWYQIQPSFIKDLNTECTEILKYAWSEDLITEAFDLKKRESTFNLKFVNKPGFYVFDTITPENIESCDILKCDGNGLYLIHVKKGFDNSIRDLTSQINIAAKRIQNDLRTGYNYIEMIERQTVKGKKSKNVDCQKMGNQTFPKDGMISLFKGKGPQNINFCLAFVDKSETKRDLKNELHKFRSNIAKFSLIELKRELNSMGFGFKIIQLRKV